MGEGVRVLSLEFEGLAVDEALARARGMIAAGRGARVYTPNAEMALHAYRSAAFSDLLARADLLLPDGVGVTAAARLAGVRLARIPGIDFAERLLACAPQRGYRLYLLGGAPGVAVRAARVLSIRYPRVTVCGARDGFFSRDEEGAVCDAVAAAKPDILFVCLGSPKQEEFIERHRPPCLAIGLGGALDVWAGDKRRAPTFVRRMGGEWLFRIACEPKRIARAAALPAFALRVLFDRRARTTKCQGRN